jgi:hypothetical protein
MAKELPYFRFTAFEWLNDDISLESYELKGLFIDICAYYWFKDCSVTLAMLEKRFKNAKDLIKLLFELGIIKNQEGNEFIKISFLNDQFDILSEQRKRRQLAGSKGGKQKSSNAKAMLKQSSSYKDKYKDNNKDNNKDIDKRKQVFKIQINEILKSERSKYKNFKQDIIDFYEYWTEHGLKDKKMRFEKEKSFGIPRRLDTWFKNKEKFKPKTHIQKDQSDFTKEDKGWN